MTLHPRKVLGIPATDTLPCFPAGLIPISARMLCVRVVGLLTISTPVATTFRPSCEKGRQSSVQEYSPFRRGLSGSLASLFRCRWLIAIPSCEAVRAVCVVLECQKNKKGWLLWGSNPLVLSFQCIRSLPCWVINPARADRLRYIEPFRRTPFRD